MGKSEIFKSHFRFWAVKNVNPQNKNMSQEGFCPLQIQSKRLENCLLPIFLRNPMSLKKYWLFNEESALVYSIFFINDEC